MSFICPTTRYDTTRDICVRSKADYSIELNLAQEAAGRQKVVELKTTKQYAQKNRGASEKSAKRREGVCWEGFSQRPTTVETSSSVRDATVGRCFGTLLADQGTADAADCVA